MPGKEDTLLSESVSETLYPDGLELVPKRFAITHRNRWMVEHSEFIIAYVNRSYGGAAQTLSYAERKKLNIVKI